MVPSEGCLGCTWTNSEGIDFTLRSNGEMKWIKPSGIKMETNDSKETIAYCESLGYKQEGAAPKEKPKAKKAEYFTADMKQVNKDN